VGTGTTAFTFDCSDADTGTDFTYAMTSGSTTKFELSDDLSGTSLRTKAALDYEVSTGYDFVLTASDGPHTITINGAVTVLDVNEHTPSFTPSGE
jgi:hypothetical protein